MDDLRTCPYCDDAKAAPMEVAVDTYALVCGNCGAIGPAGSGEDGLALARQAWNTRGKLPLADGETCQTAAELEKVVASIYGKALGFRDAALLLLINSKTHHVAAVVHRLDPPGVKHVVQSFLASLDRTPAGLIIPPR